jgi:protein translocase SEC61 complex gamma subunit
MAFNPVHIVKQFLEDSNRILELSYKPSTEEFKRTLKIVLFCVLVLGAAGFIISLLVELIV